MQLVALLVVIALLVKYWWVIVAGVGAIVTVTWAVRAGNRYAERVEAEQRRLAEIAARAEAQHNWTL